MGTCASIHKDPASTVKFRVVVGNKKVSVPPPATGRAPTGEGFPAGVFDRKSTRVDPCPGFTSPGFESKDEIFFDSRAWLDSDCEDDFFSVNGDFTPSRGSTPNFQIGTPRKPQLNRSLSFEGFPDTKSEPSPRKKLAEFFQENSSEPAAQESNIVENKVQVDGIAKVTNHEQNPMYVDGTPCPPQADSIGSRERLPRSDTMNGKEKGVKVMHCCLPNLVHSHFQERKKQTQSPELRNGG